MGTAAFGAIGGSVHGDNGLAHQVVEFEGLDQIGVEDERTVRT